MFHPSLLNAEFMKEVIEQENDSSNEIKIIDFEISPGLSVGENYCSVIYKFNIQYQHNSTYHRKYFIIKTPVLNGILQEIVTEGQFMENEIKFYKEFVPIANKLMGESKIFPKYFPSKLENALLLEDLRLKGYVMCDKFEQLDFDHSVAVMRTLAALHAVSIKISKENLNLLNYNFKDLQNKGCILIKQNMLQFINEVKKWNGFEHFSDKMLQLFETCTERLCGILYNRTGFNVLNHGDIWTNNILFKYGEDKNIKRVKLIDFQICTYGSLAMDLHYFTWTSIQSNVRISKIKELYTIYQQTLNKYLAKFGCKERITDEILQQELNFTMFYGLYIVFACFSGICFGHDQNDEKREISKSLYRKTGEEILIYLDNNGFFKR